MTSLWKNYDAKSSYDEYLTPDRKLRKEAKIISSILDKPKNEIETNLADQLKNLKELYEDGHLSEEEYTKAKKKILD